jgi:hypothetical protein
MVVISSVELRNNMKKYLDTAKTETVVIQRGEAETFILQKKDSLPETVSQLPEDFYRAISMDKAIARVGAGMRKIINKHKQAETL